MIKRKQFQNIHSQKTHKQETKSKYQKDNSRQYISNMIRSFFKMFKCFLLWNLLEPDTKEETNRKQETQQVTRQKN
jgi:hypothetical protein